MKVLAVSDRGKFLNITVDKKQSFVGLFLRNMLL